MGNCSNSSLKYIGPLADEPYSQSDLYQNQFQQRLALLPPVPLHNQSLIEPLKQLKIQGILTPLEIRNENQVCGQSNIKRPVFNYCEKNLRKVAIQRSNPLTHSQLSALADRLLQLMRLARKDGFPLDNLTAKGVVLQKGLWKILPVQQLYKKRGEEKLNPIFRKYSRQLNQGDQLRVGLICLQTLKPKNLQGLSNYFQDNLPVSQIHQALTEINKNSANNALLLKKLLFNDLQFSRKSHNSLQSKGSFRQRVKSLSPQGKIVPVLYQSRGVSKQAQLRPLRTGPLITLQSKVQPTFTVTKKLIDNSKSIANKLQNINIKPNLTPFTPNFQFIQPLRLIKPLPIATEITLTAKPQLSDLNNFSKIQKSYKPYIYKPVNFVSPIVEINNFQTGGSASLLVQPLPVSSAKSPQKSSQKQPQLLIPNKDESIIQKKQIIVPQNQIYVNQLMPSPLLDSSNETSNLSCQDVDLNKFQAMREKIMKIEESSQRFKEYNSFINLNQRSRGPDLNRTDINPIGKQMIRDSSRKMSLILQSQNRNNKEAQSAVKHQNNLLKQSQYYEPQLHKRAKAQDSWKRGPGATRSQLPRCEVPQLDSRYVSRVMQEDEKYSQKTIQMVRQRIDQGGESNKSWDKINKLTNAVDQSKL